MNYGSSGCALEITILLFIKYLTYESNIDSWVSARIDSTRASTIISLGPAPRPEGCALQARHLTA